MHVVIILLLCSIPIIFLSHLYLIPSNRQNCHKENEFPELIHKKCSGFFFLFVFPCVTNIECNKTRNHVKGRKTKGDAVCKQIIYHKVHTLIIIEHSKFCVRYITWKVMLQMIGDYFYDFRNLWINLNLWHFFLT